MTLYHVAYVVKRKVPYPVEPKGNGGGGTAGPTAGTYVEWKREEEHFDYLYNCSGYFYLHQITKILEGVHLPKEPFSFDIVILNWKEV